MFKIDVVIEDNGKIVRIKEILRYLEVEQD